MDKLRLQPPPFPWPRLAACSGPAAVMAWLFCQKGRLVQGVVYHLGFLEPIFDNL